MLLSVAIRECCKILKNRVKKLSNTSHLTKMLLQGNTDMVMTTLSENSVNSDVARVEFE